MRKRSLRLVTSAAAVALLLQTSHVAVGDELPTDTQQSNPSAQTDVVDEATAQRNRACYEQSEKVLAAAKSRKAKSLRRSITKLYSVCEVPPQPIVSQEVDMWGTRCALARSAARSEGARSSLQTAVTVACKGTSGVFTRYWFRYSYLDNSVSDRGYERAMRAVSGANWIPQPWLPPGERVGYPPSVPEIWVEANIRTREYALFPQVNLLPGDDSVPGYWTTAEENAVYTYPTPCDVEDTDSSCFTLTGLVGTYSDSGELLRGQAVPAGWSFPVSVRPGPDGKATGRDGDYSFVAMPGGGWYWTDPRRPGQARYFNLLYRYASEGVKSSRAVASVCDLSASGEFPCPSLDPPSNSQ